MPLPRAFFSSSKGSPGLLLFSDPSGDDDEPAPAGEEDDRWARMLPELMAEIVGRVDSGGDRWPLRCSVVSCAGVCRRWREVATGIIRPPLESGAITFPSSLKEPGPRDHPIKCFIKRNKKTSSFYLYLSLTETFMDKGKFLLAARRFRHGIHNEFIISLNADDLSPGSNYYVGQLRSDLLGTKFKIFDSSPPYNGAKISHCRSSRRFASKQISPQLPAGNFEIGKVSYKFNFLKSKAPRRMTCTLHCQSAEITAKEELSKMSKPTSLSATSSAPVILQNKTPRWHEHLQCWCLNFQGRVTVASVKNFQLVAAADAVQAAATGDEETVLLQFGKVDDDMFTMDYRQPLSAFQAFAISLTSFGTKFACE